MSTYKDDLDILKAAEKADTNKLTFNAITELDNKGLLGRYGEEGESGSIDLGITGAIAGEYAKIKTVDEDGVPTEWESGSGGGTGGGVLVVGLDMQTMTLDKTWNEISSAPFVVLQVQDGEIVQYNLIIGYSHYADTGNYYVEFASITQDGTSIIKCITTSADGYPVVDM